MNKHLKLRLYEMLSAVVEKTLSAEAFFQTKSMIVVQACFKNNFRVETFQVGQ